MFLLIVVAVLAGLFTLRTIGFSKGRVTRKSWLTSLASFVGCVAAYVAYMSSDMEIFGYIAFVVAVLSILFSKPYHFGQCPNCGDVRPLMVEGGQEILAFHLCSGERCSGSYEGPSRIV